MSTKQMWKRAIVAAGGSLMLLGGPAVAQNDGMAPAECVAPGPQILSDAFGDVNPLALSPTGVAQDNVDLVEFNLSQAIGDDGEDYLVFRLKAQSLADGLLPSTAYYVSFQSNVDSTVRGVRMQVDEMLGVTFFSYIASESNAGTSDGRFVAAGTEVPADPSSGFSDDGEIIIVVKASRIGLLEAGEELVGFNAATTFTVGGSVTGTLDEMPDGLERAGFFTYQPSEFCARQAAERGLVRPGAAGGALGVFVFVLALTGLRRRLPGIIQE